MSNLTEVAVPVTMLEEELWGDDDFKISHEARKWLDSNVASWSVAFWILDEGVSNENELSFIFQSDEDAMAFKLRWM